MFIKELHFKPRTYFELKLAVSMLEYAGLCNYGKVSDNASCITGCSFVHIDIDLNDRSFDIYYYSPYSSTSTEISLVGILSILQKANINR